MCFKSLIKTLKGKKPTKLKPLYSDFNSGLVQIQKGEQVSARTRVGVEGTKAHDKASAKSQ